MSRELAMTMTQEQKEALKMVCRNYDGSYGFDEARKNAIAIVRDMLKGEGEK